MPSLPSLPDVGLVIEPLLSGTAETDAHETIDHFMLQGEEYMRSLRSLRNKHTKICSFPPEVLSMILVKAVEPLSDFVATSWSDHVQLTAVCTHWRRSALDTPAFWSCIPFALCKHLSEMVARSKSCPLSVRVHFPTRGWTLPPFEGASTIRDYLPTILDASRLEEFHFSGSDFPREWWSQLPSTEAPLLRSLKIVTNGQPSRIPFPVIAAPKPCLTHLDLFNLKDIQWESLAISDPHLTTLSTLRLAYLDPAPPGALTWNIIAASPDLTSLTLRSVLPDDFKPPVSHDEPALPLSNLCQIDIEGTFQVSALFSLAICGHRSMRILFKAINFESPTLTSDEESLLLQLIVHWRISSHNDTEAARRFRYLTVGDTSSPIINFQSDSSRLSNPGYNFLETHASLCLSYSSFLVLNAAFPFGELEMLLLEGVDPAKLCWESWRQFLQRHHSITTIVLLRVPRIAAFFPLLLPYPSDPGASSTLTWDVPNHPDLLPNLEELEIWHSDFQPGDVESLQSMVCSRAQDQLTLKELVIHECRGIRRTDIVHLGRALEQYRTVIEWFNPVYATSDDSSTSEDSDHY